MNLEQQLKMTGEEWLGQEALSSAASARLTGAIRQRARRRGLQRWGAVAAGLLLVGTGGFYGPIVTSVASDLPWVGPYIQQMVGHDDGVVWAEGQGYVVPVGKSVTRDGYTFTVESILADGVRTEVFWSIAGPDLHKSKMPTYTFNLQKGTEGWSGSLNSVDGKLIGKLSLPPLPHSVSLVGLHVDEIAGIKGDWSVSFTASRKALDPLTKVVAVNQSLKGDGYDLTVTKVTLGATGTVVELEGETAPGFEIRDAELVGGSRAHGSAGHSETNGAKTREYYRFEFDRLDPLPETLTLRLGRVTQLQKGGPVLPLQPGAQTEWRGTTFTYDSLQVVDGVTEVQLLVDSGAEPKNLILDLPTWAIKTQSGAVVESRGVGGNGGKPARVTIRFDGSITDGVELQAVRHAEALPGPFDVTIPLQ
ncbi:MAG TPA: DUF4179 domain-containing protein [Symbiobacteriaceae bacterium]|nr:DUF4179 domain-containing protein [Symbiobacteriaceae bacterium]